MAINNLHEFQDGNTPTAEDLNQAPRALKGDFVPRNAAGVPQASGGDLGTETYPWDTLHVDNIMLDGQPLGEGGSTGGASLMNGVVKGKAPANRAGYPGWMVQAGSQGVKLRADTDDPLEVKLDGALYSRTTELIGGTPLPSDLSITPAAGNMQNRHRPV